MSIGGSDLDKAITQLRACRPIAENQVRELCHKARELLIEEGNVVGVDAPVTVRLYWHGKLACMLTTVTTDMRRHPRPVS
jgi:hypothetical protein